MRRISSKAILGLPWEPPILYAGCTLKFATFSQLAMFTSTHPDSGSKQFQAFAVSLCLQLSLLVAVIACHRNPAMPCPSLRHNMAHSEVTPLYLPPVALTDGATQMKGEAAAAAHPGPVLELKEQKPASKAPAPAEPALEAAAPQPWTPEADEQTASADDETAESPGGLAPFASWSMNSNPNGSAMFHHRIKEATPVFTPDPPILHADIPEPARGKDMVVEVVINENGAIAQATVLQGIGFGVEDKVMETLRRWIFIPAKVNGMAIASRLQFRFHFPG
jgi:TonB family protein